MTWRLVILSLVLISSALPASAATSTFAPDPLKEASVNLYCRLKAGKSIYGVSGSGVFISERGVILTNAHVAQYFLLAGEAGRVTGWCSVRTGSPAKEMYTAEVLYIPPSWLTDNLAKIKEDRPSGTGEKDFALLYVTGGKKGTLPTSFPALAVATSTALSEGTDVTVVGYPTAGLNFSGVRNKLSIISDDSSIEKLQTFSVGGPQDVFTLASSSAASYGVSGGLVADENKSVLGIITSKSTSRLRGISIPYINRALTTDTGVSLTSMLRENFTARAAITQLLIPDEQVAELAKGLRSKSY